MLGLRLGERPRVVVTTTPRTNAAMRRVNAAPGVSATFGKTRENPWLPGDFGVAILDSYGGPPRGPQELHGDRMEDVEGALWTRVMNDRCLVSPDRMRSTVGVWAGEACTVNRPRTTDRC